MAIQIRRQLKYGHPMSEAIAYIKTRLTMHPGEPLLCTYKETNGKWGAIEVVCIYPKGTNKADTILTEGRYNDLFDSNGQLIENHIKINSEPIWGTL